MAKNKVKIQYSRVTDGHKHLIGTYYVPFDSKCRSGATFEVSAQSQKNLFEDRGMPVKVAYSGGLLCPKCIRAGIRLKQLRKNRNRTPEENEELKALEEADFQKQLFRDDTKPVNWPYR